MKPPEILDGPSMDRPLVVSLYRQLQGRKTRKRLERLYSASFPAARTTVRKYYYKLSEPDIEELLSMARAYLWEKLPQLDITPEALPSYLHTALRKKMAGWVKYLREGVGGGLPEDYADNVRAHVYPTHRSVEADMYLADLPLSIYNRLKDKIRFNSTTGQACLYVAKRLLSGQRPIPLVMKRRYDVKDVDFVIDYTVVLCRQILYRIREEHNPLYHPITFVEFIFSSNGK